MVLTDDQKRALMTPSGRPTIAFGSPRPPGPYQDLVPITPPSPPPPHDPAARALAIRVAGRAAGGSSEGISVGIPNLVSALTLNNNQINPQGWAQLIINLWRLAQPTGITPGTFAGITFNAFGQAVFASSTQTGGTIDNATINSSTLNNTTLTGTAVAPTPAANDNSTTVATTAFVKAQGYATQSFVTGQGYATESFVTSQGFATESWVLSQGFVTEAPAAPPGQAYARSAGSWILINVP